MSRARRTPGGVYQREGKTGWWASLTSNCGTRRAQLCLGSTKEAARRQYTRAMALRDAGKLTPEAIDDFRRTRRHAVRDPGAPTLASAFEDFASQRSSKKSWSDDLERWRLLTAHLPDSTPLRKLTARRVDDALAAVRRERGLSEATINRYRALVRSVLKLAQARTELGFDPRDITTTKEVGRDRVLSADELAAFFEHVQAKHDATTHPARRRWLEELVFAVKLALMTAARAGELGALEWRNVDIVRGTVRFADTKNKASRLVPLSPEAVELLRAWREQFRQNDGIGARVLESTADTLGKRFGVEAKAAGLLDVRLHDLRRTAAVRLLEGGVDARVVSSITGHRDLGTLLKHYARASDNRRREAAAMLGAFGG